MERAQARTGWALPDPAGRGGEGAVVVGYDETPGAEAALRWGAVHAESLGLQLLVTYAANPPVPLMWAMGAATPGSSVMQDGAEQVAQRAAVTVRRRHPTLRVRRRGAVGSPAAELVSLSDSAPFVVVGRHADTGPPEGGIGSVAFALSTHARCPVVVVPGDHRQRTGGSSPVVVGVDASRASLRALSFAARLAAGTGTALVVVSAWAGPRSEPWMADRWDDPAGAEELRGIEHEGAERCVGEALALVRERHPGVTTRGRTVEGSPTRALLREAVTGGLVVVGSRGRGGFAGLMLGSVGRSVLRQARVPVAMVRDGAP